jgi:hypothetical protein
VMAKVALADVDRNDLRVDLFFSIN